MEIGPSFRFLGRPYLLGPGRPSNKLKTGDVVFYYNAPIAEGVRKTIICKVVDKVCPIKQKPGPYNLIYYTHELCLQGLFENKGWDGGPITEAAFCKLQYSSDHLVKTFSN